MRARATIALIVVALAACGGRAQFVKSTTSALATALAATNATSNAFVSWDKSHQAAIVANATTKQEAQDNLASYRNKRRAVVRALTVAYSTIAAAATLLPLVENGSRQELELVALVTAAVEAAADVKKAIDALREKGTP